MPTAMSTRAKNKKYASQQTSLIAVEKIKKENMNKKTNDNKETQLKIKRKAGRHDRTEKTIQQVQQ